MQKEKIIKALKNELTWFLILVIALAKWLMKMFIRFVVPVIKNFFSYAKSTTSRKSERSVQQRMFKPLDNQ